ncbi:unnamed protein product [Ambrosiozyma monospora]|uniref:Unnamed protein product n=1 Tax=Ambrosiozyma monospora TaxID=43982 RepID=A0ACB5U1N1_AMBMO|nr:unnamed protein product [Ambrosiozyma monospora]
MLTNITSSDTYFEYKGSISGVSAFVASVGVMILSFFGGIASIISPRAPFFMVVLLNFIFFVCLFKLRDAKAN